MRKREKKGYFCIFYVAFQLIDLLKKKQCQYRCMFKAMFQELIKNRIVYIGYTLGRSE